MGLKGGVETWWWSGWRGRMEVGVEGIGESVGNVDGDGGICLAEEFACCVGIEVEVVFDEGVYNFGVKDEDGREA